MTLKIPRNAFIFQIPCIFFPRTTVILTIFFVLQQKCALPRLSSPFCAKHLPLLSNLKVYLMLKKKQFFLNTLFCLQYSEIKLSLVLAVVIGKIMFFV